MVWVKCPKCGHYFEVDLTKGKGAYYTRKDFTPSNLHEQILKAIRTIVSQKMNGATKQEIENYLKNRGINISGNSLSGRLSELLGAGYVEVKYTQVQYLDEKTKKYRFKKTPIWYLSIKGVEYIKKQQTQSLV
jgi:arginine repressor